MVILCLVLLFPARACPFVGQSLDWAVDKYGANPTSSSYSWTATAHADTHTHSLTHSHTHSHTRHMLPLQAPRCYHLAARPFSRQAASPIPPGSSVPNVAGGLVWSHAERTEKSPGASAPREAGGPNLGTPRLGWLPYNAAGCCNGQGLLASCHQHANSSNRGRQSDRFVESCPDKGWCGWVDGWPWAEHLIAGPWGDGVQAFDR